MNDEELDLLELSVIEWPELKLLINKIFVTLVYIIRNTVIFALDVFVPVLSRWLLIPCPLARIIMHDRALKVQGSYPSPLLVQEDLGQLLR